MKPIIALTISLVLLLAGGYFATTTASKQTGQSCVNGDEVDNYQNTWQDVYFFWQWWPYSDDDNSAFIDCVGPASYIRYHPYDAAALAFIGAGVAGLVSMKYQSKGKKNL